MVSSLEVKKNVEKFLLGIPTVQAVGVSRDKNSIVVYLENDDQDAIDQIPPMIGGYPVIIKIIGKVTRALPASDAADNPVDQFITYAWESISNYLKFDPFIGGVGGGNTTIGLGTLGGVVKDEIDGEPVILTNNHVICGVATKDQPELQSTTVIQPAVDDGGTVGDKIGDVKRFVSIDTNGNDNLVDAAISSIDRDFTKYSLGKDDSTVLINTVSSVKGGEKVWKYGRATNYTEGFVEDVDMTTMTDYGDKGSGIYVDQILVRMDIDEGDSGSLLFNNSGDVVGLIFAMCFFGDEKYAIANKIRNVETILDIDVGEDVTGARDKYGVFAPAAMLLATIGGASLMFKELFEHYNNT